MPKNDILRVNLKLKGSEIVVIVMYARLNDEELVVQDDTINKILSTIS